MSNLGKKWYISMVQIIQTDKNSIESIHSRMNQCEDRISGIEDRIPVSNHEKKDALKKKQETTKD